MKIGVYDSGIGGFGPLHQLYKKLPRAEFYYYADDLLGSYGNLDETQIIKRCHHVVKLLSEKNIDLLFIACNTATAIAIDSAREEFNLEIVGIEPYLNALHKEQIEDNSIAAIMTEAMSKSQRLAKLKERVDPENKITIYSMPKLAGHIEKLYQSPNEDLIHLIKDELRIIKPARYKNLILGCTHYPLIQGFIEKELGLKCLDPSEYVIQHILKITSDKKTDDSKDLSRFHYFRSSTDKWSQISWDELRCKLDMLQNIENA